MKMNTSKIAMVGVSAIALLMLAFSAQATNLVTNGEFSLFTNGGRNQVLCNFVGCDLTKLAVLTDWTNTRSFTAVYGPNAAETTGASGLNNNLYIWGPLNGGAPSNNFNDTSPNQINNPAANFIAADSDPTFGGFLTQTINTGLVQGQKYELSYNWAAAQFTDAQGPTDSGWTVMLGTQRLVDGTIGGSNAVNASIPRKGFSGWNPMSVTFTYVGGPTNLLSFFANGSPTGLPPLALLDSVSLVAVPEPETYALLGLGLLGILAVRRQQKKRA